MADVLTIPLTTLAPGSFRFPASGGQAIADTDTALALLIDRTVSGGLSSLSGAVSVAVAGFQSNDGGTTWRELGASSFPGGQIGDGASPDTSSGFRVSLFAGTSRQVMGTVQVTGGSVAVAGTLTMS